jgi:hypothetical protein
MPAPGIGHSEMVASAGTLVHLPAGTTHWFRFGKGGGGNGVRHIARKRIAHVHRL